VKGYERKNDQFEFDIKTRHSVLCVTFI